MVVMGHRRKPKVVNAALPRRPLKSMKPAVKMVKKVIALNRDPHWHVGDDALEKGEHEDPASNTSNLPRIDP